VPTSSCASTGNASGGVVCWQASFASAELNTLRGFTAATP